MADDDKVILNPGRMTEYVVPHIVGPNGPLTLKDHDRLLKAAPALLENAHWVCKLFGTDHPEGVEQLKSYIHALRCAVKQAQEGCE